MERFSLFTNARRFYNVIVLSLIHGKELERNFNSFILKKWATRT